LLQGANQAEARPAKVLTTDEARRREFGLAEKVAPSGAAGANAFC
jgi:hypothetical protein